MTTLETAILKTVAYFDIFDYPLTTFEIWQYLEQKTTLSEVITILQNSTLPLEKKFGFFFLPGRIELVAIRQERYRISDKKIKKLKRRLYLIQWLPGIELICLANNIGTHNLRRQSDNDLFIITRQGRLWTTKLWATLILALTHLRPTTKHNTDRLCLSFLIDDSALDLSSCRLETDAYFTYWLAGLVPLYGNQNLYKKLLNTNQWFSDALPNWSLVNNQPSYRFHKKITTSLPPKILKNFFETAAKYFHGKLMAKDLQTLANKNKQVIITDHILKLHTFDRRTYFQTEYDKRLTNLGLI